MAIGQSGCSAYFPEGMPEFTLQKSEDGADVYTSELDVDGYLFGCITVRFTEPFSDSSPEELEDLLIGYLDYLEESFDIYDSVGVGRGHTLECCPSARGVIDYWDDLDDNHFAVKGWINQNNIGILFIAGEGDYPHFNLQQMYLDGFRFGE